jgi:hypothetical protein
MCFFSSKSSIGQKILNVCKIGSKCSITGTVKSVRYVEAGEEVGDCHDVHNVSFRNKIS